MSRFALVAASAAMMIAASESFVMSPAIPAMWSWSPVRACRDSRSALYLSNQDDKRHSSLTQSRREWLAETARKTGVSTLLSTYATVLAVRVPAAQASVNVDPDRYGDKELKIAIVNRVRQNIRDVIVQQPALGPAFLEIAIQDALTFDALTESGGPDGSIVNYILACKSGDPLYELRPAAQVLLDVRSGIRRSTEITMGDLIALAGAEAVETIGGPRIVVQLGKLDPSTQTPPSQVPVDSSQILQAFRRAGLTEREAALLYGAKGAMERTIASSALITEDDAEPVEENEMGDTEVFIPSSFGSQKEMYGKQLGKLDNSFFVSIVDQLKKRTAPTLWKDETMAGWATKYAKSGFVKDLPEAYGRLTRVGTVYTGGKVGSLTGIGENIL